MGWNDTFTSATDWSALSFVEMFYKARNERAVAKARSTGAAITLPVVGDDVQNDGFWSLLQTWLQTNCTSYCDADITLPFAVSSLPISNFTLATWRTKAGINSSGFTRKYPREFLQGETQSVNLSSPTAGTWTITLLGQTTGALAWNITAANLQIALRALPATGASGIRVTKPGTPYNIIFPAFLGDVALATVDETSLSNTGSVSVSVTANASTTYTDSSAFSNGHRARALDDGNVYDRTGGAWVVTSNPTGDPPDTVTAYGTMMSGDYIGPWIFNELRDGFNALTREKLGGSKVQDGKFASAFSNASWSNVVSQIAADFPNNGAADAYTYYWGNYGPPPVDLFDGGCTSYEFQLSLVNFFNSKAATVTFYAGAVAGGHPNGSDDQTIWDANGTALQEDEVIEIGTASLTGAGGTLTVSSDTIGDSSTIPNQCPQPSTSSIYQNSQGWKVVGSGVLIDWDFEFMP